MKLFITSILFLCSAAGSAVAAEQSLLARVTVYWRGEGQVRGSWHGVRLRDGHCAVDPKKIPYGSRVVFPDTTCLAVDTGPAVVNRTAARACARTAAERSAVVIDRFFETREQARSWETSHPQFMTVRVVTAERSTGPRVAAAIPSTGRMQLAAAESDSLPAQTSWSLRSMFDPAALFRWAKPPVRDRS
jgi:3D (Asp-Asp-Asp) domain-containing protein